MPPEQTLHRDTASQERVQGAADALHRAFVEGEVIDDLPPNCRPATVDEARRVHDALVHRLGGHGGWKVGQMQPGREPSCAPLPAHRILHSPARWDFGGSGPLEIEVEVAVLIGQELGGSGPISPQQVVAAIASLHPALEVVSSRLRQRQSLPALTALADLQAHGGLVLGPPTRDWQSLDLAGLAMSLSVDGQPVAQVATGASQERMLAALGWLAHHARERGKPLRPGQVILTGARILATPVPRPARLLAQVQGLGRVELAV